jgi:hypothetical protein
VLEAKIQLTNALGPAFIKQLAEQISTRVGERMSFWGNKKLDQYTTPENKEPYSMSVDGMPARSRADFQYARKSIQIYFIRKVVTVAIDAIRKAMETAINMRGPMDGTRGEWTNVPAIEKNVDVFYGGKDKPIVPVRVNEITSFSPGDVILVVPKYGLQVYANATKYRGSGPGIMAMAVRSIRSILQTRNKQSVLQITATRSRAAFYKMLQGPKPVRRVPGRSPKNNTPVEMTIPWPGADSLWVIAIRYRSTYKGAVNG